MKMFYFKYNDVMYDIIKLFFNIIIIIIFVLKSLYFSIVFKRDKNFTLILLKNNDNDNIDNYYYYLKIVLSLYVLCLLNESK